MNVRMPDGTILRDVPEGTTQEELLRQYKPATKDPGVMGYAKDALFGGRQVLDAGAQGLTRGLEALMPAGSAAETWMRGQRQGVEGINEQARQAYQQSVAQGDAAGSDIARGVVPGVVTGAMSPFGKAATTLRGLMGQGAALGAGASAFEPVYGLKEGDSFLEEKLKQAGLGAAFGGGASGALGMVGKAVKPAISDAAKLLVNEGVTLTPGQLSGGAAHRLEDAMTSLWGVGDIIGNAKGRTMADFNRALFARALKPLGPQAEKAAKMFPAGNKGIQQTGNYLSDAYEDALSRSVPAPVTPTFNSALQTIQQMVPVKHQGDFTNVMNRTVWSKVTPAGTVTPSVAKDAESEMGRLIRNYAQSADGDQKEFARALRQAQQELRDLVKQANPVTGPEIQKINKGYATLVQLEFAANKAKDAEGVFTPNNLLSTVRQKDPTVRHRGAARGEALNQDIATAATQVIPSMVPDSGTPTRGLVAAMLAGNFLTPAQLAAAGATALPYTGKGQKAFQAAMVNRPAGAEELRKKIFELAPYGAIAPAVYSYE